jgi:LacI family transcriptional regulator
MADLDYSRNSAAQMLASGKSGAIGVIFPPIENKSEQPFFMKILTAINEEAHQNKITVSIASGHTIEELLSQVRVMYQEKGLMVLSCFMREKLTMCVIICWQVRFLCHCWDTY